MKKKYLIITGVKKLLYGNQSFLKNISAFLKTGECEIYYLRDSRIVRGIKSSFRLHCPKKSKKLSKINEFEENQIKGPVNNKKLKFNQKTRIKNDKSQWIISLPAILVYLPMALFNFLKKRDKDYNLIVGYEISGVVVGWFIKRVLYKNAKLIGIFQGTAMPLDCKSSKILNYFKNLLYYPLDLLAWTLPLDGAVITNDGTDGKKVAQYFGVESNKIFFETNGVDYERLNSLLKAEDKVRKKPNEINIVCLMRFVEWKRIDRIIEIANEIKKSEKFLDLKINMNLIGDGPEFKNIESLIKEFEVRDIVTLLGKKTYEESIKILKSCDFSITTSDVSNINNLVLDSMAIGIPIISVDSGSLDWLVETYNSAEKVFIIKPEQKFPDYETPLYEFIKNNSTNKRESVGIISIDKREEMLCDWLKKTF
jgi:glycosyltransferase involved in cell wall biosynthesis